jgi:putative flippase GtrA
VLHGSFGVGPMISKAISLTAATVLTYLGSRFWTFRHRVNQALLREGALFAVLNLVGLGIAEVVIATATYGFGLKSALAYNAASVAGTGLGTIFRYFSYKKWVFLPDVGSGAVGAASGVGVVGAAGAVGVVGAAGGVGAAVAAGEAAVSGIVEPQPSYGPPWESLDEPEPSRR